MRSNHTIKVTKKNEGEETIFQLEGSLDQHTVDQVEKEITNQPDLILDLSHLHHITAAGLRFLIEHKATLIHVPKQMMETFEMSGILPELKIDKNQE